MFIYFYLLITTYRFHLHLEKQLLGTQNSLLTRYFMTMVHQKNLVLSCVLSSKDTLFLWLQLSYSLVIFISKEGLLTMLFFTVGLHFCGGCNLYSNLASFQISVVREAALSIVYTSRKVFKKSKKIVLQINKRMWKKITSPSHRTNWSGCLVW